MEARPTREELVSQSNLGRVGDSGVNERQAAAAAVCKERKDLSRVSTGPAAHFSVSRRFNCRFFAATAGNQSNHRGASRREEGGGDGGNCCTSEGNCQT